MSYSVCLQCRNQVFSYEKYCDECAEGKHNDLEFWKTHDYSFLEEPKKSEEIRKDTLKPITAATSPTTLRLSPDMVSDRTRFPWETVDPKGFKGMKKGKL